MRVDRLLAAMSTAAVLLGGCGSADAIKLSNAECARVPDGRLTAEGTLHNLKDTGLHHRNYELHVKWLGVNDEVITETLVDVRGVPEGASRTYRAVSVESAEVEPARCDVSVRAACAATTAEVGTCGRLNVGHPPPSL